MSRTLRQGGSAPNMRKTSVPPRFGVCASAPPAPETARSETATAAASASSASHQSSAFASASQYTPSPTFRTLALLAAATGFWKSGITGTSFASRRVGPVEDLCLLARIEDAPGLVEVAAHQPLAVPGVVLHRPQPYRSKVVPGPSGEVMYVNIARSKLPLGRISPNIVAGGA